MMRFHFFRPRRAGFAHVPIPACIAVIMLLLSMLACSLPILGNNDVTTSVPSLPAADLPTPASEEVQVEAPVVPLTQPAALLVRLLDSPHVQMLDFEGNVVSELDLSSLGDYIYPHSIGGNTPDSRSLPPLILQNGWDGTLHYFDGADLQSLHWEQATQSIIVPGTPYLAISKTENLDSGVRSSLFVASGAELAAVEPVFTLDSINDEWLLITPLQVAVTNGQPSGVWYTLSVTGMGGDIVYPIRHSLYYLDLATGQPQEILSRQYNPSEISVDGNWVVLTQGDENRFFLTVRSLQTGEEYNLPLDPASDRGAGYASIAPDNSKVAWMEASGSWMAMEPNFQTRLKIARFNGELLYDFDGSIFAEKIGAQDLFRIVPVMWLDANNLLVQAHGGGNDAERVGLLKVNIAAGTVETFSYSAFISPVYQGENLTAQAPSQTDNQAGIPEASLSMAGPWVALPSQERLWAANPDGSGVTPLINQASISWYVQKIAAAPQGGYLAFTASWDNDNLSGLTLFLAKLPEMTVETITELSSAATQPPENPEICDPNYEAARAAIIGSGLAWSPDGQTLAFIGAQEGTTADVYMYSLETGEITQVTDGPSQAFDLSWSPDSKYVAHFGARCFGTGGGFDMMGAWAVNTDGSDVITLYEVDPQDSGERVVGWLGNSVVVVESFSGCPAKNLRKVNLESGTVTMLYEGCYYDSAMAEDGTIGLINADDIGTAGAGGLMIFHPSSGEAIRNPDLQGYDIEYSPGFGAFLLQDTEFLVRSVNFAGEEGFMMTQLEIPVFSPSGSWWASPLFESLEVGGEAGPTQTVFSGMLDNLIWATDPASGRETLFFFGGPGYSEMQWYAAYPPDFEPTPVSPVVMSVGSAEPIIIYP